MNKTETIWLIHEIMNNSKEERKQETIDLIHGVIANREDKMTNEILNKVTKFLKFLLLGILGYILFIGMLQGVRLI